ncbi:MAG: universal stress protein [Pseudonocardiaceae bacterium]|nr:universal stress protein [Pseudonocardiaceae bacterium]
MPKPGVGGDAIVVGTDGSDPSLRAVRWAATEAVLRSAPLLVLHAIGVPDFLSSLPESPENHLLESLEKNAAELLRLAAETAEQAAPGVRVSTKSTMDASVPALIDMSGSARMIVLGKSGRGGFRGLLVGSTTATLTGYARCPVVAIRGRGSGGLLMSDPIVVGVDGSPLSDMAIALAFEEAALRGAPLVAVHAWSDADTAAVFSASRMHFDWEPLEDAEKRVLAENLAGWQQKYPDVPVRRVLVRDKPRNHLLTRSAEAGLIVVGSRGRGGFGGLMMLGSTGYALIHHARCPVMVARSGI